MDCFGLQSVDTVRSRCTTSLSIGRASVFVMPPCYEVLQNSLLHNPLSLSLGFSHILPEILRRACRYAPCQVLFGWRSAEKTLWKNYLVVAWKSPHRTLLSPQEMIISHWPITIIGPGGVVRVK